MELRGRFAKLISVQPSEELEYYASLPQPEDRPVLEPVGPNNPPWGVWEGIGTWVASVLLIIIVPGLFLLPYLATLKPAITENEQLVEFAKTDPTAVFLQIVSIIPAHLFTVLLAWLVITRVRKYSFRKTLGWETGGFQWWYYPAILIAFFVVAAIVGSLLPEKENDMIRMIHSSRSAVYIMAFLATFTAPFVEEVVYRGVLYSSFQRRLGVPAAFLLTTFLFALVHVPQYWPSYSTLLLLGILSLVLTSIRVKTNNLWPCIVLHTLFNGLQSALLLAEPFLPKADVQQQAAAFFHILK